MLIPIAKRLVRSLSRMFDKKNVEKSRSSFFDEIIAYIRHPYHAIRVITFISIYPKIITLRNVGRREKEKKKSVGGIIEGIKKSDRSEIRRDG